MEKLPTYWEYLVWVTFNPSNSDDVSTIKSLAAELINKIDFIRNTTNNPEAKRCASKAITEIEDWAMRAVKAATKPESNYWL